MNSKDTQRELDTLIRARYPIINLKTFEESRAEQMIAKVVRDQGQEQPIDLLVWSFTQGLKCVIGDTQITSTTDPIEVLTTIETYKNPAVFILRDYHKFIRETSEVSIVTIRKLRDIYDELKESSKTVILLSPTLTIPLELQKSITPLDLPLPDKSELEQVLDELLPSVKVAASEKVIANIDEALHNGNKDAVISAGLGLTADEFEAALKRTLIDTETLDIPTIIKEKEQIIKKSGILEYYSDMTNMAEVGGHEALKTWLKKVKQAYTPKAAKFGLQQPKGVMLTGFPGTGKSLFAKAAASILQQPLLRLDAAKLFGSHVGESEQNMSYALDLAAAVSPSILWIDEAEKVFAGSAGSGELDSGVTKRVVGKFLTWMQEHKEPVFVLCTCNDPLVLPPEFMRAGRLDEVFFVDLPHPKERTEIFAIHIQKAGRGYEGFDLEKLAAMTDGYSGAEIEAIVQTAMKDAFFDETDLTQDYLEQAAKKRIPLSKKREKDMTNMRIWGKENAISSSEKPQDEQPKKKVGFRKKTE